MGFSAHKWTIFLVMYVGYFLYVLCRKSFSFSMPTIMAQEKLAKDDLGLVTSSQLLAYTISKFLGGLASDVMSPKTLFTSGLLFTGLLTVVFTWFSNVWIYAALWFGLGFVQGGGFPACAKIIRHWFSPTEFGTYWSVLSTSMNVACSAGPIVATFVLTTLGWRYLFNLFGTFALGWVAACLFLIVNKPEDVGIEGADTVANSSKGKGKEKKDNGGQGTWIDLFSSPLFWSLCFCYLVVMAIRIAALDWGQMYLIQDLEMSQLKGSAFVSAIETGGIIGSILAGYIADKMVANSLQEDKRSSPRWTVAMFLTFVMALCLYLMIFTFSGQVSDIYIMVVGAGLGATLYGCIALYGIISMEAAPSHLAGTSHAIVCLFANIGGIFAGLPFSYIAKMYNWGTAFYILGCAMIPMLILKVVSRRFEYQFVRTRTKVV